MSKSNNQKMQVSTLADVYEIRFDIPANLDNELVAEEFASTFGDILENQRMTPLVSSKACPESIYVQACLADKELGEQQNRSYSSVVEILSKIGKNGKSELRLDEIRHCSDDWQGFRIWMKFKRNEIEKLLERKKHRRRFRLTARRLVSKTT